MAALTSNMRVNLSVGQMVIMVVLMALAVVGGVACGGGEGDGVSPDSGAGNGEREEENRSSPEERSDGYSGPSLSLQDLVAVPASVGGWAWVGMLDAQALVAGDPPWRIMATFGLYDAGKILDDALDNRGEELEVTTFEEHYGMPLDDIATVTVLGGSEESAFLLQGRLQRTRHPKRPVPRQILDESRWVGRTCTQTTIKTEWPSSQRKGICCSATAAM